MNTDFYVEYQHPTLGKLTFNCWVTKTADWRIAGVNGTSAGEYGVHFHHRKGRYATAHSYGFNRVDTLDALLDIVNNDPDLHKAIVASLWGMEREALAVAKLYAKAAAATDGSEE